MSNSSIIENTIRTCIDMVPMQANSGLNQIGSWFYPDSLRGDVLRGGAGVISYSIKGLIENPASFFDFRFFLSQCNSVLRH